ncbi:MAG: hypothetical protein A3F78_13385 [Burkholderiales bacterium RIFCSPLOWO2_12_FULL_61_40]|nr:MAG: hypothetical protein A3F78_13385 [Burkholderiales bacterium RIFCSPLOWO2_12_FULL_61_40]
MPVQAEDIDLFSTPTTATTDTNAPVLLFVWDNGAGFNASSPELCSLGTPSEETAATGAATATALSGKTGGVEQCAIFNVIQAMSVTATAKIKIGIMAWKGAQVKDYNGNDCSGTQSDGGCLLYPVTPLTLSTKVALLTFIKSWKSSNSGSGIRILADNASPGPATSMQEAWAYLHGKTGFSGTDYASIQPPVGCSKYFVAFVGNNFGNNATMPKDGGSNPWSALSGTFATTGVNASPAATALETTHIKITQSDKTTSCKTSAGQALSTTDSTVKEGWYADEWTRYMKDQDIKTYTIGLIDKSVTPALCDASYAWVMRSMAAYGGGKYFETSNTATITDAFETIISEVQSVNSVFAAVSLPVSVNTQGTYLNQVFVGMFRPDPDSLPRWVGNLKQYKMGYLNNTFRLLDADSAAAISASGSDFIAECARSFWTPGLDAPDEYWASYVEPNCQGKDPRSNTPDGNMVEKGGQAYKLRAANPTNRTMYTCEAGACTALINFTASTSPLKDWQRGFNNGPTTGLGAEPPATIGTTPITSTDMRPSAHGDVVHSRPIAINFGSDATPKVVVFYGGNDGVLRAINGNQTANIGTVTPGSELWAFVPPEFYSKIQRRYDNTPEVNSPAVVGSANNKDYGMDGPVTGYIDMADTTKPAWIYASMRRGGRALYAFAIDRTTLAVTAKWKKGCDSAGCTTDFEQIGQTWAAPTVFKASGYGSGDSPLLIMGGGYDAACEDPTTFTCTTPASGTTSSAIVQPTGLTGNRIYILDADTGERLKTFKTYRGVVGDIQMLQDASGMATYGYAADVGGDIYRISGATANTPIGSTAPANWTMTRVAMLGCNTLASNSAIAATSGAEAYGTNCTSPANRKFLYGPDIVVDGEIHYLLIGSGNREQPVNKPSTVINNYFFVVQDKPTDANWLLNASNGNNCNSNDVLCKTIAAQTSAMGTCLTTEQAAKKIYAYPLRDYEQVVTASIAAFGTVYFSTHEPTDAAANSCSANLGTARAYALNFKTGGSSTKACGESPFTTLAAGGLPPSPVVGKVKLDDGTVVPFVIGGTGPLEASKLNPPSSTPPSAKVKSYWYIQK